MKLCTAVQEGCGYKDTLRAHHYFAPSAKYFTVCITYQPPLVHLFYVTSYFVVFDWKNLQNEQLYTLLLVPITCCTLTTKICPFSDLHITLDMEQIHYCWAAKKYLLLGTSNSQVR